VLEVAADQTDSAGSLTEMAASSCFTNEIELIVGPIIGSAIVFELASIVGLEFAPRPELKR